MAELNVSVTKAKSGLFEGTVSLPGLAPTKLAAKKTGVTEFGSKGALAAVARGVAKNLGFESATLSEIQLHAAEEKAPAKTKKAAKASAPTAVAGDA